MDIIAVIAMHVILESRDLRNFWHSVKELIALIKIL